MKLHTWVRKALVMGASDLHFEAGTPVVARVREELLTIGDAIPDSQVTELARELIGEVGEAQVGGRYTMQSKRLPYRTRHRDGRAVVELIDQRPSQRQSASGSAQAHRPENGPCHRLRADGLRKIHDD